MKAAERKAFRAWVRRTVTRFRNYMYLDDWRIDLIWEGDQSEASNPNAAAHIDTSVPYLNAVLHLMPWLEEVYKRDGKTRVAEILVHELCHIVTEPLFEIGWENTSPPVRSYLNTVREQTTQMMAICVFRGIPESLYHQ